MGYKATNLKGKKFGRLTVLEATEKRSDNKCVIHKCKCSCGNIKEVSSSDLTRGIVKSCGCLQHETNIENGNQAGKIYIEKNIVEGTNIQALQTKKLRSNTSGIKGVHWDKARQKWVAKIIFQGKEYFLGRYAKKEDAIDARAIAEKEMHEKFLDEHNLLNPTNGE